MAWSDAKAQLVAILAGVAITSPVAQTVKKVYANPPGTVQDVPCFIVYPPSVVVERPSGTVREKRYQVRCRLLVLDADLDRASDLCDAYREAVIDTFDDDVTLNLTVSNSEMAIEEASSFTYGQRSYTGFDVVLTIDMTDAVTHQA